VTGFIDGTSNLDPRHTDEGRRLTFVEPDAVATYPTVPVGQPPGYAGSPGTALPADLRNPPPSEPSWTRNGTYMVVRSSTIDTTGWDRVSLGEQEHDMGRFKFSGAFLDRTDDPARLEDPPAFEADQSNRTVAVDSHARKSNPRRPEDIDRRIFRRGYPLIAGTPAGFDRGLLFIAFGRSISTQFEFIFRAWMRNPNFPEQNSGPDRLFRFEKQVTTGGYYFVPPIELPGKPWTWALPA
jgi:Dyp-type peroxidase family